MKRISVAWSLAVAALLSACATTQAPTQQTASKPQPVAQKQAANKRVVRRAAPRRSALAIRTGTYRCELGRKVFVKKVSADQTLAVLNWRKRDYTMKVVHAPSGALRLENKRSGLTWITVVGKSMLLDTKRGKQLANECRA